MNRSVLAAVFLLVFLSSTVCASSEYMNLFWNSSIKEVMSGMDVGDINGDGILEIFVSASSEGIVYAYGFSGEVVWKFGVPGYVNFVKAVNLDDDNRTEILTGTSSHFYVINSSGDLLSKFYTENKNVENAEVLDIDGDGLKDILFSASTGVCSGNVFYALNSSSMDSIWIYDSDFYYPNVIRFINVSGETQILVGMVLAPRSAGGCLPSERASSKVVALSKRGEVLWSFNTSGGVIDMKVGDVDGDGFEEIVLASYPSVYVLDDEGILKWEEDLEDRVDGIALAGMKDGRKQVLAATYRAYLLDSEGDEHWIFNTSDRSYSVAAGDLNDDGNPEYVVGSDKVYLYDYNMGLVWNSNRLGYVGHVFVGNFDNLPDLEVAAGSGKQVLVFKTGIRADLQKADVYYSRAQQLYSSGQYSTALNYATQAKDIYYEFQQDASFRRTRDLIGLINTKINSTYVIEVEADVYYNRSVFFYTDMDFINASVNAQIARAKYSTIGSREGINKSEQVFNKSMDFLVRSGAELKKRAAEAYLDGDFENALKYAETAKLVYSFLRDSSEVSQIDELIREITPARKLTFSERLFEFMQQPEVKKYLYPSENQVFNMTWWFIYLVILGLLLITVKSSLMWFYHKLTRKTLDLDKLPVKKPDDVKAGEIKEKS